MPLNAVQNAANYEMKSINIHYDCITNPFQTMKHMAKKGKLATKKWGFRAKKRVIGVGKLRVGNQTRKAKWCKMQVICQKTDRKRNS